MREGRGCWGLTRWRRDTTPTPPIGVRVMMKVVMTMTMTMVVVVVPAWNKKKRKD